MNKTIVLLLLSPALAHAGGFAVSEQTAVSAGTGGAGAARDDDPGAAWYDPAALADGGGLRLDLSLIFARPSLQAQALDGSWSTANDAAWATPPHFDASFARDRWAAGLSVGIPFGSGISWPAAWPGRHEIVATDLKVLRVAPFGAYRFGDLRVAVGAHADFGRMQIQRDLDFIDMDGDVAIDMDGHGFGVDASLYYEVHPTLSLGAVYRSRTAMPLSGGANFTTPDAFSAKAPDQSTTSKITLPDELVLGARYTHGNLALLADVEVTLWSSTKQLVIDFAEMQTPDVTQDQSWHDAVAVRLGAERTAGKLTLRGGTYVDQSPAPAFTLAPSSPDASRLGLSGGASWRFDRHLAADAFVEAMWLLRRDTTDVDALQASYGGHALLGGVGLRWTP